MILTADHKLNITNYGLLPRYTHKNGTYNQECDWKGRRPEEEILRLRVQWAAKAPAGVQGQCPNGRLLPFVSVGCNSIIRYHFQDLLDLTPPYIFSTNLHDSQKLPNLTPDSLKNHIPV